MAAAALVSRRASARPLPALCRRWHCPLLPAAATTLPVSVRACASSSWPSPNAREEAGSMAALPVSERRLQEFLEAEVTHFAAMNRRPITLEDLLRAAASPRRAAAMVRQELPKHFAARLRQIEELPGWKEDASLSDLHSRYRQSFQELRMTEVDKDLTEFTAAVRRLKQRQRKALSLIGEVLIRRRESVHGQDKEFWMEWLNKFLQSRICTEMLTSQYMEIINQMEAGRTDITGIVDPECDPASICRNAAEAARTLCANHLSFSPIVEIEVRTKRSHAFSYIPLYLHYILLEVLKNSCYSTAQAALISSSLADPVQGKPIQVVICSDDHRVAIRISDMGGGIPFDVGERVWDFGFSGSSRISGEPAAANALAGYGLGLPMARLYARYLGGSLSLVSLPEYGVDTYLFLPRIDTAPILPATANSDSEES
eukprot:TRINITY_DN105328_c0_g1_i1.p1 TRINITY_DN105328_c0_g1~~TRINITY_DN105328_c0_g1_i1.p1  ORF type:complete len:429 (-),score=72.65 TRINITY_DN105328_c0_g1_i1:80-1366(-)